MANSITADIERNPAEVRSRIKNGIVTGELVDKVIDAAIGATAKEFCDSREFKAGALLCGEIDRVHNFWKGPGAQPRSFNPKVQFRILNEADGHYYDIFLERGPKRDPEKEKELLSSLPEFYQQSEEALVKI